MEKTNKRIMILGLLFAYIIFPAPCLFASDYPLSNITEQVVSSQIIGISPDGSCLIYVAKYGAGGTLDLYSVPVSGGTPVRLNPNLACGGDINTGVKPEINSTSTHVVYKADQDTDNLFELYSVPINGGTSVKLNKTLSSEEYCSTFKLSPDGSSVIYSIDNDNIFELYSVPVTGGTSVKLNGTLVPGGSVHVFGYEISSDSSRVVYLADQDTDEVDELYSVPITGGTPVKLNWTLVDGGNVYTGFKISPDSSRVVYIADQDTDEIHEIYSIPITGGTAPVKLNPGLMSGQNVYSIEISPDSSIVVYRGDQDTDEVLELFSVPITGGTATKLNGTLASGDVDKYYYISPDSSRVVYAAAQDTPYVTEIYSVPIAGGVPIKLNETPDYWEINPRVKISPDSSMVIYGEDIGGNWRSLFSVPVDGGTSTRISDTLNSTIWSFYINSSNSRVVYLEEEAEGYNLYSVPVNGGSITMLNSELAENGSVEGYKISSNGSTVVYGQSQNGTDTVYYSTAITGGGSVQLSTDSVSIDEYVQYFITSPDGSYTVFSARNLDDECGTVNLYSIPSTGETPVRLNPDPVAGGNVSSYMISPDSQRVVYQGDQDTDGTIELYSVPVTGGDVTRLNPEYTGNEDVTNFQISPDSSAVVYGADQDTDDVYELFAVPITGGSPVKLNKTLTAEGDVTLSFKFNPDSSRVVYRADQDTDEIYELYSVPLTGPASSGIKLNKTLVSGGDVMESFTISPSNRVVYLADQDTDEVYELYQVPIAGPAGSGIKLNGTLPSGGDVSYNFQISSSTSRIIYMADQDANDVMELYSVHIMGGTPVQLNEDWLHPGGNVSFFNISADGDRAVYQADQDKNDVTELYSVSVYGGSVIKLNGSLVSGGDVLHHVISPDSNTVVYLADQDIDGVNELFRVSIGGSKQIKLNPDFSGYSDVSLFLISPYSDYATYYADPGKDEVYELFSVPLSGGTPFKLNGPLVSGGDVRDYLFSSSAADSQTVVYLADQETDGVDQLYGNSINGQPLPFPAGIPSSSDNLINGDGKSRVTISWADSVTPNVDHYEIVAREGSAPSVTDTVPGYTAIAPGIETAAFDWTDNVTLYVGVVAVDTSSEKSLVISSTTPYVTVVNDTCSLTVTREGSGSGTVTSSPGDISCGSTCTGSFSAGTVVTLAASADAQNVFTGWSGCSSSRDDLISVSMSINRTCSAAFETDTDSDGMPDDWEIFYGLNVNVNDADEDEDGDGFSNLKEYLGDSDPTDPNDRPVKSITPVMMLLLDSEE